MSSGDWTEGMAALANSCEARRGSSEGDMGALRLFLAAAALSIGACAATDHFQQRIDRYDLAAAESRDQMIFTNILRASRAEPLSFVQMGRSRVRPRRPRRSGCRRSSWDRIFPWARAL
jgi:hypothetical protein